MEIGPVACSVSVGKFVSGLIGGPRIESCTHRAIHPRIDVHLTATIQSMADTNEEITRKSQVPRSADDRWNEPAGVENAT